MSDLMADAVARVGRIDAVPRILRVVCETTGMGFAAVARVTEDRWVACSVQDRINFGLTEGGELKLETTICNQIRRTGNAVIIESVDADPQFVNHQTPKIYGFKSYISVPITLANGSFFGTLCAIDPRPAVLTPAIVSMFTLFAELIASHLDAEERLVETQATLVDERKTSELREQFIAVLGHDLRNPLASIDAGARMLQREPQSEKSLRVTKMMQQSVQRMAGLIDNVLDFARARLGGGFNLHRRDEILTPMIQLVADELHAAWPDRTIHTQLDLPPTVNCDGSRIGQLVSNLLGNALAHGSDHGAIALKAECSKEKLIISVTNQGATIPEAAMAHLFKPFARGELSPHEQGLGLGLYISSEIARAHNGILTVTSKDDETVFTFEMPLSPLNFFGRG